MQIAICDDDPMIIKELQKDLEQYFRKHHLSCPPISQFTSGESLLNNKEEKDIKGTLPEYPDFYCNLFYGIFG